MNDAAKLFDAQNKNSSVIIVLEQWNFLFCNSETKWLGFLLNGCVNY